MAINCLFTPNGVVIEPPLVTPIDTKVAPFTVNVVLLDVTEPNVALILLVPVATAVTNPLEPDALLIVAVKVVPELHVTLLVITWVLLSEYVPTATICCVVPLAILGVDGVIAIELNVALLTVKFSVPDILPSVAVILKLPEATGVNNPLLPTVLLIVAIADTLEPHVTFVVKFWVLPSEYVPVAVNCCVMPSGVIVTPPLVTAIDNKVALLTLNVVLPDTPFKVAVIILVPAVIGVTRPLLPTALLIVAVAVVPELHVTKLVITCVLLSEYVPIATICLFTPNAVLKLVGVTDIDTNVAFVIIKLLLPDIPPKVAVIIVPPVATGVAKPVAVAIVATLVLLEPHVTDVVIFAVVLLEYVPVAVNCIELPSATLAAAGVTDIDTKLAFVTVNTVLPFIPSNAAVIILVPVAMLLTNPLLPAALLTVA